MEVHTRLRPHQAYPGDIRPGLGDRHTDGGPDEQFDAELAFQRADRLGQRRLAQMQPPRGRRQAPRRRRRTPASPRPHLHAPIAPRHGPPGPHREDRSRGGAARPPSTRSGQRPPGTFITKIKLTPYDMGCLALYPRRSGTKVRDHSGRDRVAVGWRASEIRRTKRAPPVGGFSTCGVPFEIGHGG
jgi:hypothetical protein